MGVLQRAWIPESPGGGKHPQVPSDSVRTRNKKHSDLKIDLIAAKPILS